MAKNKTAPQRAGREAKEARALEVARRAVDELSDDPEVLRMFVAMVPLLSVRRLRGH